MFPEIVALAVTFKPVVRLYLELPIDKLPPLSVKRPPCVLPTKVKVPPDTVTLPILPVVLEYSVPLEVTDIGEFKVYDAIFKDPPDSVIEVAVLFEPRVSVPLLTVTAATVPEPLKVDEFETVTGPPMFELLLKFPPLNTHELADLLLFTLNAPEATVTAPEIDPFPDIVPAPLTKTPPVKVKFDCANVPPDNLMPATVMAWVKLHEPDPVTITLSALLSKA